MEIEKISYITSYNKREEQREGKVRQMIHISHLVFVQHKNKKRKKIMDKPNFIDIKKLAGFAIRRISVDILKAYSEESIAEYLEKYECQTIQELVYLVLCEMKPEDMNISLNMRQKIKNISDDISKVEVEDQERYQFFLTVKDDNTNLNLEIKEIKELVNLQNKKVQEVIQINKSLELKLKAKKIKSELNL